MINYYKFIEKFYNLITKRILGGGRQRNKTEVITLTKAETKTLLESLAEVPDHRVGNAIKYSLRDILFLGMFAILCGAETYTGIQVFSELHLEELQQNLELPHGVPSHDVFGDVFSRVDLKAVEKCFQIFYAEYAESDILPQDKAMLKQASRYAETNEKEHGRMEKNECWLFDDAEWFMTHHDWLFLHCVAVIHSIHTMLDTGEVSTVFRYFIFGFVN